MTEDVCCFEDLGIGKFLYNPYVQQKFRYKTSDITKFSNELKLDDVVQVYMKILSESISQTNTIAKHMATAGDRQVEKKVPINSKDVGRIVGPKGSHLRLIENFSGVLMNVEGNKTEANQQLCVRGTPENIAKALEFVQQLLINGPSALHQPYQTRFEDRLRDILQLKYNCENISRLGVITDAKSMHELLVDHSRSVRLIFKTLSENYARDLENGIPKLWTDWCEKKRLQLTSQSDHSNGKNDLKDQLGESAWKKIKTLRGIIPNNSSTSMKSMVSQLAKQIPFQNLETFFSDQMSDEVFWNDDLSNTIPTDPY